MDIFSSHPFRCVRTTMPTLLWTKWASENSSQGMSYLSCAVPLCLEFISTVLFSNLYNNGSYVSGQWYTLPTLCLNVRTSFALIFSPNGPYVSVQSGIALYIPSIDRLKRNFFVHSLPSKGHESFEGTLVANTALILPRRRPEGLGEYVVRGTTVLLPLCLARSSVYSSVRAVR